MRGEGHTVRVVRGGTEHTPCKVVRGGSGEVGRGGVRGPGSEAIYHVAPAPENGTVRRST